MKRQHPIAILRYTSKYFWLLLIPLIRGLRFLKYDFYGWISGAYIDIIVLLIIIASAFIRWYNVKYCIIKNGINFSTGVFFKHSSFVSFESISTIKSAEYLTLKLFKAVVVYVDTDINSSLSKFSKYNIKIVVDLKEWKRLLNKITINELGTEYVYKSSNKKILLFSLAFSSTLSGLLYVSALILNGGRLVAEEIENRFLTVVNNVTMIAQNIISGVSPFSVSIIIIIAVGWMISFIKNYVRHINFRAERCQKILIIKNGFFSRRSYFLNVQKINCIDLKQNLLMKLCKVVSVHISCAGYGKRKTEIPLVMPVKDIKNIRSNMQNFLPEIPLENINIFPQKKYLAKFISMPLFFVFGTMIAGLILTMLFPAWYKVIYFSYVMIEIILIYFYFVRLMEYFTNGVGFNKKILTMKYRKFFQFHYIMIPYDKISAVQITQNIFQTGKMACDLIVYEKNEILKKHRVRNINMNDLARNMFNEGYYSEMF